MAHVNGLSFGEPDVAVDAGVGGGVLRAPEAKTVETMPRRLPLHKKVAVSKGVYGTAELAARSAHSRHKVPEPKHSRRDTRWKVASTGLATMQNCTDWPQLNVPGTQAPGTAHRS